VATDKQPWASKYWLVSPWNFMDEVTKDFNIPEKVTVVDTTLRDGEQTAGVIFSKDDKIQIAEKLAEVGVHGIEACYIGVSEEDEAVLRELTKRNLGHTKIYAACRAHSPDVKKAADCGVYGVYMGVPSSPHALKYAYGWTMEEAQDRSIKASLTARELGLFSGIFPIDGSRSDMDWYFKFVERIAQEGAMDRLVIADTYGVLSPHSAAYWVKKVKERIDKPLDVHFHNNFGMATANTIAGVVNGAEVINTTTMGLGEEAGNAPLEEVAVALRAQYGVDLGIKYDKLCELAELVSKLSGEPIPPSRPFVGSRVFTIEAGITAHTYMTTKDTNPLVKFPVLPEFIGHKPPEVVIGKYSGTTNVQYWAEKVGIELSKDETLEVLNRVKAQAIKLKRLLTEEEFKKFAQQVKQGG
jgi:isopropylmalate/homocitrate/citramalate synthase